MDKDYIQLSCQFYEYKRLPDGSSNPNDPDVQLRAPIDVFDFVKLVREMEEEINDLYRNLPTDLGLDG